MMNKKSMLALAVALLAALAAGCQCSGLTASPSPAPDRGGHGAPHRRAQRAVSRPACPAARGRPAARTRGP